MIHNTCVMRDNHLIFESKYRKKLFPRSLDVHFTNSQRLSDYRQHIFILEDHGLSISKKFPTIVCVLSIE